RLKPDRQRSARNQSGCVRYKLEAAGYNRMGMSVRSLTWVVLVCTFVFAAPRTVRAQTEIPPMVTGAERAFDEALSLFESGDYESAAERFDGAAEDYTFNRGSTAAMLMAGKSLYRAGDYLAAERALDRFVRRYPESRYVAAARETMRFSRVASEFAMDGKVVS